MKAGFRGWLYRWISGSFGLTGIVFGLSALEIARLYGFPSLGTPSGILLAGSFFLWISAFLREWNWKRYFLTCLLVATLLGLPYVALRPEMIREEVRRQLVNPPLTVDILLYRGLILGKDPERDLKVERLEMAYGLLRTYGENARKSHPGAVLSPIPEVK